MKTQKSRKAISMLIMAIFLGMGTFSYADQTEADKTKPEDLKEKATETFQAFKKFTTAQRNEAVKKAKDALDDLDAQIDHLESELNKKWDQMDQTARKKTTDALTTLRKQRNVVAEWYGGLKQSSGKAWEEVKQAFVKSYQDLRDAFMKARGAF
ncbi:MAG: hypothetical protein A2Y79_03335 [Deltaproteobacteria bacterium RBG_13_43_22]|nr:MAG: hypothetical protein A2Y79_03335 [Deltaproteobacteria bacterium RBG_13_43_22]